MLQNSVPQTVKIANGQRQKESVKTLLHAREFYTRGLPAGDGFSFNETESFAIISLPLAAITASFVQTRRLLRGRVFSFLFTRRILPKA